MPVLSATGPDSSDSGDAANDWTLTLAIVGAVGLGLALLAIFTPDEAGEEVVVSDSDDGETVDSEALEAIEASREAEEEEEEAVEDDLFREIEGD